MKQIASGIYVETGYRRVTVGAILTEEGWVLIDTPPFPEEARNWRRLLSELADLPVLFIVNTDHHRDRVLGNQWFDAQVVAHRAAADRMLERDPTAFVAASTLELASTDEERTELSDLRPVLPHISYADGMALEKGGRTITLTHVPGATPGSTWIDFPEEKVVFVGDHIVTTTHPFMAEADSKAWLDALTWLRRERFEGYKVVPGRGAVTNPEGSHAVSDYVRSARRRVQGLCRSGRPRSDTATLVDRLIADWKVRDGSREEIERRVRAGLERIYDEVKESDGD